jgi:hypothetical protein
MPHRSSRIIFWLLLAATLSVDLVSLFWIAASKFRGTSATLFMGLAYGQLSALCVWAIVSQKTVGLRWIVPFVVGLAAGLFAAEAERPGSPEKWDEDIAFIGLFWVHVVVAIVALWSLKPTSLVRDGGARIHTGAWRFSTKNLMVLMTVTAVLVALLGRNRLLSGDWGWVVSLAVGNVAMLLVAIGLHRARLHRIFRFAGVCATALLIGAAWKWSGFVIGGGMNLIAFYLIQAVVVWLWLQQILSKPLLRYGSGDASGTSEPREQSTTR